MQKKLYKTKDNAMLSGVCAGISEYLNLDVSIVRLIWVLLSFSGPGLIVYIVMALILPDKYEVN